MLLPTIIIYASTIGYSLIPGLPAYTAIWVFWVSYCLLGLGFLLQIFVRLIILPCRASPSGQVTSFS